MPHYKKAFDIGTYTGNGGQYRVGIPTLRSVGPSGTQVAGSLRFRASSSTYLTRTPGVAGNRQKFTVSFWVKKSIIGSDVYVAGTIDTSAINGFGIHFYSDTIEIFDYGASSFNFRFITTQTYRDSSIWQNIVVSVDTTQATAANRVKIYVNGVQITAISGPTYPSQNFSVAWNNTVATSIGRGGTFNTQYFDGYLSQFYNIDGQQLDASSFGELNSDGIWVSKSYSGTYGTCGFYLPMNSSSNYATDQSGNGNNFTPSGFNTTTANTTYDIMTDSPTDYLSGSMSTANNAGNYCTWNPLSSASGTTQWGNLYYYGPGSWLSKIGTMTLPPNSKIYFEATITSAPYTPRGSTSSYNWIGVGLSSNYGITQAPSGGNANGVLIGDNGYVNNFASSPTDSGTTFVINDVIGVAIDTGSNSYTFYRNNTSVATGTINITAGTQLSPMIMSYSAAYAAMVVNFGQRAFSYTPPSGYTALNTYNYPRPADSSLWFYGDTPDLMWIKNRSASSNNVITDTVRGIGINKVTNARSPDLSYPSVSEMNKFGMSVINDSVSVVNGSGNSHVYWGWKANGSSTVTNTDGTNTSQVSANRQAGFSIVSWVYNSSGSTIGHGLGAAPSFIIQYSRTTGYNTDVYHVSLGATKRLTFNTTSASETFTGPWNNTEPTSSVFSSGASWWTNGDNMLSYCWTAIPGYSAFGSYTGNGSADGPFVYLGFRPRFVLYKRTDSTGGWVIIDTSRDTYNYASKELYPHLSNGENSTSAQIDVLSNGYKIRTDSTYTYNNASGGTYIYAAFAEIPFKFARAR